MSVQTLKEWSDVDIRTVQKQSVVDVRDIKIDRLKSREERIADYIKQVKNPYLLQCNDVIVKMSFDESKETLGDKLESYFLSL